MSVKESVSALVGPRDLINCFLASLVVTMMILSGTYFANGGSAPSIVHSIYGSAPAPATMSLSAPVISPVKPAPIRPAPPAPIVTMSLRTYRVVSGDYLSKISQTVYGNAKDWTAIYWANSKQIKYADIITTGQVLTIPDRPAVAPAPPAVLAPSAPRPVTILTDVDTTAIVPQSTVEQSAPSIPPAQSAPNTSTGYAVSSSFQACVIRAESGGNPQIWNASGHWGLYQFSYSTWVAHGGIPADFGHAGAAEQTQIFLNTVAQDGTSDWAPYDGC